jgi:hypothetical protein
MRKRRKALLWTLLGLALIVGVFFMLPQPSRPDNQPFYKGRPLVYWLDVTTRVGANKGYYTPQQVDAAEEAVRAIGTNAFPSLLQWTQYKTSAGKRAFFYALDEMPGIVARHLHGFTHRREELAELGVQGFRILHTNAFAFEALSKMASDTNNPWQEPASKALLTITNTPAR